MHAGTSAQNELTASPMVGKISHARTKPAINHHWEFNLFMLWKASDREIVLIACHLYPSSSGTTVTVLMEAVVMLSFKPASSAIFSAADHRKTGLFRRWRPGSKSTMKLFELCPELTACDRLVVDVFICLGHNAPINCSERSRTIEFVAIKGLSLSPGKLAASGND
nr:hypothetical protein Iba_chr15aCG11920 [Ipomoea batatas]